MRDFKVGDKVVWADDTSISEMWKNGKHTTLIIDEIKIGGWFRIRLDRKGSFTDYAQVKNEGRTAFKLAITRKTCI